MKPRTDEVRDILRACRGYFVMAAIFSLAINLLYLASPLYMLQVYDRVISSASNVTLVMPTIERSTGAAARSQPLRDFDTFRQFVTGGGIHAVFDLPWAPIYIAVIFLLHPFLGLFALACTLVLVAMAVTNEWLV